MVFFMRSVIKLFFLQHVSMALFHLCPRRFGKALLALIFGGTSKSRVFGHYIRIYTRGLRHYKELSIVIIPC